jgi:hypothetical protein
VDSLTQLDRLPLLRDRVWFHSVSSQDVTGGNEDGFTAEFSNQYAEDGRYVFLDARRSSTYSQQGQAVMNRPTLGTWTTQARSA